MLLVNAVLDLTAICVGSCVTFPSLDKTMFKRSHLGCGVPGTICSCWLPENKNPSQSSLKPKVRNSIHVYSI